MNLHIQCCLSYQLLDLSVWTNLSVNPFLPIPFGMALSILHLFHYVLWEQTHV